MEITKIDAKDYKENKEYKNYDEIVKIVLIGDSGVGKTSILRRITDDDFSNNFISTIGVDFKIITYKIKKNNKEKILKIQFWDTAGQERFRNITNSYYRNAKIILVVFDMHNRESFENVNSWISLVKKYNNNEKIKIILICNKYENNKIFAVNTEEIINLASKYDLQYVFTSAKFNSGFDKLLNLIFENYEEKIIDTDISLKKSINLNDIKIKKQDNTNKSCSC